MDISLVSTSVGPAYTPPAPSANKLSAAAVSVLSAQDSNPDAQAASNIAVATSSAQRKSVVETAAQSLKESFPVSDVRFTIYKDSSGQYVTRFTNLDDGKVTYFPEQTMFAYFKKISDRNSLVNIKA